VAGLILHAPLILIAALAGFQQRSPLQDSQDVIKISNVCVIIRHNYEYTIVSSIDYFQVNVSHNGVHAHIYVGYNPRIIDENRKWQSRSVLATLKSPKTVPLVGAQTGEFLGVPIHEGDRYFHLWFDEGDSAATGPIKEIVGFCSS
jgi:hypothetical protein